jgi:hypothetical protein
LQKSGAQIGHAIHAGLEKRAETLEPGAPLLKKQ